MDIVAIIIIIIISLVLIFTFYMIGLYNGLVDAKNRAEDQFTQIDIELKKRIDLIPGLVETVKKYAKHEDRILDEIINKKNKIEKANSINNEIKAANDLNRSLNKIYALTETYSELNKDKTYQIIRKSLEENDDRIDYARTFYNDTVLNYNNTRCKFPSNIIAKVFKFREIDYLK